MYRRQPHLPIGVTLGLTPWTTTAPTTLKFVQKMREQAKWAQKKAEAKEAQCHKKNYENKAKQWPWGWGWRHGSSPCNHLQGLSQNPGQMGE